MDKKFDVVIVGTGAAGLYAALNFRKREYSSCFKA